MRHLTALDHALLWMALSFLIGTITGWRAHRRLALRAARRGLELPQ